MRWCAIWRMSVLMLFHRLHPLEMRNNPSQLFQPFGPSLKTDMVLTSSPLQLLLRTLTRRLHLSRLNLPVAISIMTASPEKVSQHCLPALFLRRNPKVTLKRSARSKEIYLPNFRIYKSNKVASFPTASHFVFSTQPIYSANDKY